MRGHPIENMFRQATEVYSSITSFCCSILALKLPDALFLSNDIKLPFAISFFIFGLYRGLQALNLKKFQRRLRHLPLYSLKTNQIPISKKYLFIGKGFRWYPKHTQRLMQIKQIKNEKYVTGSKLSQSIKDFCRNNEKNPIAKLLSADVLFNPFRPQPPLGGSSFLHGIGNKDKKIKVLQSARAGHTLVVGTTGVGKTRAGDFIINQDIRNNAGAVIVIDPKGDLDLVRGMYAACSAAGRLDDFKVVHLGFPDISAQYNPLKNYDNITEIATRITDAISAEGEGKQFADFAWKFTDIVNKSLKQLSIPLTYDSISFYISRMDLLLELYADSYMPTIDDMYEIGVQSIKSEHDCKTDKNGNNPPPMSRSKAIGKYLKPFIDDRLSSRNTDDIKDLVGLYDAAFLDKTYYDKITASIGPVFSKINGSNASKIFSFTESNNEIEFFDVIKNKKVIYIGLDSLSNFEVSQAVGKALLSDLVSIAGKIYKETSGKKYLVNIHVDELSEVIQESFVKILNKARGAGFRVTAYCQTKQDLEVALGSSSKADMAKGNFSNIAMLRVENKETAGFLIDSLPKVEVFGHTQVSTVTDTPHGENKTYFNTNNEDRVQMTSVDMLDPSDISSIPAGQAFFKIGGNELYKVRIPLAKIDRHTPKDIISCIRKINNIDNLIPISKESSNKPIEPIKAINDDRIITVIDKVEVKSKNMDAVSNKDEQQPRLQEVPDQNSNKNLFEFKTWLINKIESGHRRFSIDAQKLILTSSTFTQDNAVFITDNLLFKYESRSGVSVTTLKEEIFRESSFKHHLYINEIEASNEIYPIHLEKNYQSSTSSKILEGDLL